MKRKIQFRGWSLLQNKWVYGHLVSIEDESFILPLCNEEEFNDTNFVPVDPESVGQYVGDYKGNAIFEGDMVEVVESDGYKSQYTGTVIYDIMDCRFNVISKHSIIPITGEKQCMALGMGGSYNYFFIYKVIGNEYEEKLKISNP